MNSNEGNQATVQNAVLAVGCNRDSRDATGYREHPVGCPGINCLMIEQTVKRTSFRTGINLSLDTCYFHPITSSTPKPFTPNTSQFEQNCLYALLSAQYKL